MSNWLDRTLKVRAVLVHTREAEYGYLYSQSPPKGMVRTALKALVPWVQVPEIAVHRPKEVR